MISFLIVNHNGGEVFKQCIASLSNNCSSLKMNEYEIIVVDNASTDDLSWIEKIPALKLVRNKTNLFFSVPTNDSVRFSSGDIVFLLNNDVILKRDCLKRLLAELKKPGVDAVVPKLVYPDGRLQQSITGLPTWKDVLWGAFGLHLFNPGKDKWRLRSYDYSKKHIVRDQPMFSALMLKRKTWNKVGELDPGLPLLWNDVDWFKRFHDSNLTCMFVPEAEAKHVHGMSVNKMVWKKLYLLSQGCYVYLTKHAQNKSVLFKSFIAFICTVTFFERIPLELMRIISSSGRKR